MISIFGVWRSTRGLWGKATIRNSQQFVTGDNSQQFVDCYVTGDNSQQGIGKLNTLAPFRFAALTSSTREIVRIK